ncbi:MAG: hypothetical protein K0Q69_2991, partial [Devosia sp.]|nr:hypothetical protein [Devosia sp.]
AISEALSDIELSIAAVILPPEVADGTDAEHGGGGGIDPELTEFLATLRKRYTMDVERRVHDAFTGIEVATEPAAETSEAALDDLFF